MILNSMDAMIDTAEGSKLRWIILASTRRSLKQHAKHMLSTCHIRQSAILNPVATPDNLDITGAELFACRNSTATPNELRGSQEPSRFANSIQQLAIYPCLQLFDGTSSSVISLILSS
jgi:hypothetical protein